MSKVWPDSFGAVCPLSSTIHSTPISSLPSIPSSYSRTAGVAGSTLPRYAGLR
ncbi:hypothetical protein [Streptomyces sp. AC555_RSS877]|uniref:hypothetical protein n=1 Tax=Streptomyces sp. AC555_RSS877 TaxID=2823688 RepID=UPI001C26CAF0|nr:hypothetical protein [Streptomyces sp. AC555_RSS877]